MSEIYSSKNEGFGIIVSTLKLCGEIWNLGFFLFSVPIFYGAYFLSQFLLISACNWCYFLFTISGNQQHTHKKKRKLVLVYNTFIGPAKESISYVINHSKVTGRFFFFPLKKIVFDLFCTLLVRILEQVTENFLFVPYPCSNLVRPEAMSLRYPCSILMVFLVLIKVIVCEVVNGVQMSVQKIQIQSHVYVVFDVDMKLYCQIPLPPPFFPPRYIVISKSKRPYSFNFEEEIRSVIRIDFFIYFFIHYCCMCNVYQLYISS